MNVLKALWVLYLAIILVHPNHMILDFRSDFRSDEIKPLQDSYLC